MFNRFEHILARHGLAQQLSRTQRQLAFYALFACVLFTISAFVSTALAILVLIGLVIAHKVMPMPAPATFAPNASQAIPSVSHRPTPELIVGFDAFMRPARDLLKPVAKDQRAATMIALLEVMEVVADVPGLTAFDLDELQHLERSGALPRLTKDATALLANGATVIRNIATDTPHGRFLSIELSLPGGTDVAFHWNVRMIGGSCFYRIDQTSGR